MSAGWDESRTELLKRLWVVGETARTIAERLGGGVTRNAVIGKAHRLGLTGQHGKNTAPTGRSVPQASSQKPHRKPRPRHQPR